MYQHFECLVERKKEEVMIWTKKPPRKPGWYWTKADEKDLRIVEVAFCSDSYDDRLLCWRLHLITLWLRITQFQKDKGRVWAGPLQEPTYE